MVETIMEKIYENKKIQEDDYQLKETIKEVKNRKDKCF